MRSVGGAVVDLEEKPMMRLLLRHYDVDFMSAWNKGRCCAVDLGRCHKSIELCRHHIEVYLVYKKPGWSVDLPLGATDDIPRRSHLAAISFVVAMKFL
jgi:hypothetical protein